MTLTTLPTLNINALRRTQLSIMDTSQPFDMNDWSCCIHGHAHRILGLGESSHYCRNLEVGQQLGLTGREAEDLFVGSSPSVFRACNSRQGAVEAIDALIASRQPAAAPKPEPEPEPIPVPYDRELVAV